MKIRCIVLDALTVSETSTDAPQSDDTSSINHPRNLATEALYINQNFRRMVLKRVGSYILFFKYLKMDLIGLYFILMV